MKKTCWFLFLLSTVQILFSAQTAQVAEVAKAQEVADQLLGAEAGRFVLLCFKENNYQEFSNLLSSIRNGDIRVSSELISIFLCRVLGTKKEYGKGTVVNGMLKEEDFLKRVYDLLDVILTKYPDLDLNTVVEDATPLIVACGIQNLEIVQLLLRQKKIDLNRLTMKGTVAALFIAYGFGDLAIVRALIHDRRININLAGPDGVTALLGACIDSNFELAKELLQHPEIDLNCRRAQDHATPLIVLCMAEDAFIGEKDLKIRLAFINFLLTISAKHPVDVNATGLEGRTALMFAAVNDFYEIFERLLADPTIDVNVRDQYGCTILRLLFETSFHEDQIMKYVERLLAAGIGVNISDQDGITALMMAADLGFYNVVERLLRHPGIELMLRNRWGELALTFALTPKVYTALYNADTYTALDLCKLLSAALVQSRGKIIPLILKDLQKLQVSDEEIVSNIVEIHRDMQQIVGEDIINPAKDKTLIGSFLKIQDVVLMNRFIPLLLRADQEYNIIDPDGNTLLHLALRYTVPQEVSKLIADKMSLEKLSLENNDGYTALTLAKKLRQDDIKKYLQEKLKPERIAKAKESSTPTTVSLKTVAKLAKLAKQDLSAERNLPAQAKTPVKQAKAKSIPSQPVAKAIPKKAVLTVGEKFLNFRQQLQAISREEVTIPDEYQIRITDMLGYSNVMVDFNHILKINVTGNSQHGALNLTLQGAHFDPVIQRCVENGLIDIEHSVALNNGFSLLYVLKNKITQDIATKTVFDPSLNIQQICEMILSAKFIKKIEEAGEQDFEVDVIIAKATLPRGSRGRFVFIKCILERNAGQFVSWQLKTAYPLTDQDLITYEIIKVQ